jgi:hypothetical protein
MRAFWSDPYLWVHAAGIAALPFWFLVCLFGFAVGDPILPPWLELGLVAIAGIAPISWMQSQRPFYIFSLLAVALRAERLTEDQRRILTIFRARRNPIWIGLAAFVLFLILNQIYTIAPIAAEITPIPAGSRGLGLIIAAIGFLGTNLFTEVPLSVLHVMLTSDSEFCATAPISLNQILKDFLIIGVPVNQLLPPVVADSPAAPKSVTSPIDASTNSSPEGEVPS